MPTLSTMRTRIADEIARADLTSQIALAVTSAIEFYSWSERMWMSEYVGTFSTVVGQEWYTDSDTGGHLLYMADDDSATITLSGYPDVLRKISHSEMQAYTTGGTTTGTPIYYSIYRNRLRFYPVPDAIKTITLSYVRAGSTPSATSTAWRTVGSGPDYDAAEGFWTTEAEELIRLHAKIDLFENTIRDFNEANLLKPRLAGVLNVARSVANRRNGTGRVVAEYL